MATTVKGTHVWCQKGGFIYFANVFTSSAGLLLLSLTDTLLWKTYWQNYTWWNITYDAALVLEERHERGGILDDKMYCHEKE